MPDLPYIYTDIDRDGQRLSVGPDYVIDEGDSVTIRIGDASHSIPASAADLMARAILAAAGDTGHVVIDRADLPSTRQAAYMAAMSMRTRAADAARQAEEHPLYPVSPRAGAVEAIRALPLLPDASGPHGGEG